MFQRPMFRFDSPTHNILIKLLRRIFRDPGQLFVCYNVEIGNVRLYRLILGDAMRAEEPRHAAGFSVSQGRHIGLLDDRVCKAHFASVPRGSLLMDEELNLSTILSVGASTALLDRPMYNRKRKLWSPSV
jgi:hypothetical protein